jgi:hypothetical protein
MGVKLDGDALVELLKRWHPEAPWRRRVLVDVETKVLTVFLVNPDHGTILVEFGVRMTVSDATDRLHDAMRRLASLTPEDGSFVEGDALPPADSRDPSKN